MTTPTGVLFQNPLVKPLSTNGLQQAGCTSQFYLTGTTTPANIYADGALTTPLANPVTADSTGTFPAIYLDPNIMYRVQLKTSTGVLISDTDPYIPAGIPIQSGSFTMGTTGFSGTPPSGTAEYIILFGRIVILFVPSLIGTSNTPAFTLTGLPAAIIPTSLAFQALGMQGTNNNLSVANINCQIQSGTNSIALTLGGSNTGWTASNSKSVIAQPLMWLLS